MFLLVNDGSDAVNGKKMYTVTLSVDGLRHKTYSEISWSLRVLGTFFYYRNRRFRQVLFAGSRLCPPTLWLTPKNLSHSFIKDYPEQGC